MALKRAEISSPPATMQWSAGGPLLAPLVRSMGSLSGPPEEASLPGIVAPDAHVECVFHLGETWWMERVGHPGWLLQSAAFVCATSRGGLRFQPSVKKGWAPPAVTLVKG